MIVNVGIGEKGSLRILGKGELKISGAVEGFEASRRIDACPARREFMESSRNGMEALVETSHKFEEFAPNNDKQPCRFDLGYPLHKVKSLLATVNLLGLHLRTEV